MDYLDYIVESKIIKKSDIQINIPTFNSYETTKNTIKILFKQKDIKFDILFIDNASEDYKKLIKDFPDINYVVLKENTGGSGAQRIGAELALKKGYDYIIFTDNDAILLSETGLQRMFKKLKSDDNIGAVAPKNIEKDNKITKDIIWKKQLPFHYIFVKSSLFKKISLHNFYIFLYSDDTSLTSKIVSNSKLIVCGDIFYYHDVFQAKCIQYTYFYFHLRGLLIIVFRENDINFKLKITHLFNIFYKITLSILRFIQLRDPTFIKIVFSVLVQFVTNYKKIDISKIPPDKYLLKKIDNKIQGAKEPTLLNLTFLHKAYCFHSNYYKKDFYYKLEKQY